MEELKLYIDRLRSNEYKDYSFLASPEIMGEEENLSFKDEIAIEVSATLANDHLVFNTSIKTKVINFCKICNQPIVHDLAIEEKHTALPLEEVKNGVFSLEDHVRELIFLNVPEYSECNGSCPEREALKKYLKPSDHPIEDN